MRLPSTETWKESLPGLLVSSEGRFFRQSDKHHSGSFKRLCPAWVGWEKQRKGPSILRIVCAVQYEKRWQEAAKLVARAWAPELSRKFLWVVDGNPLNVHPENLRRCPWASWLTRPGCRRRHMASSATVMDELINPVIDQELVLLHGRMPRDELCRQYMRPWQYLSRVVKRNREALRDIAA